MDKISKISVIIPVYNVADYVRKCIESVTAQSYRDLEIIIVDDGSTDASGKICDEMAQHDARIQVVHQENGGLSDARNTGLNLATGDYITFVDSDDAIANDMLEVLYANIVKYNADFSICRYCNVWDDGRSECIGNDHITRVWTRIEGLKEFLYGKTLDPFACGKLYKASLIGETRFLKGIIGEDIPFNMEILKKAENVVLVGESKYLYLQKRPGAICNVRISRKRIDSAFYWENVRNECKTLFPQLEKFALRRQVLFYIGLYNRLYDEAEYTVESRYIQSFLNEHLKEVMKSDICERTVKIATFLLAKFPLAYISAMKLYKRIVGEARL